MPLESILRDSKTGRTANVVRGNAIAVLPPQASIAYNATLGVDDVPVEIVPSRSKMTFCMTGILLTGNKSIDPNIDAIVDIYTSTDSASSTIVTSLISIPVSRSGSIVLNGILVEAEAGHFINGRTSDDDVLVTILGFYV